MAGFFQWCRIVTADMSVTEGVVRCNPGLAGHHLNANRLGRPYTQTSTDQFLPQAVDRRSNFAHGERERSREQTTTREH